MRRSRSTPELALLTLSSPRSNPYPIRSLLFTGSCENLSSTPDLFGLPYESTSELLNRWANVLEDKVEEQSLVTDDGLGDDEPREPNEQQRRKSLSHDATGDIVTWVRSLRDVGDDWDAVSTGPALTESSWATTVRDFDRPCGHWIIAPPQDFEFAYPVSQQHPDGTPEEKEARLDAEILARQRRLEAWRKQVADVLLPCMRRSAEEAKS